MTTDAPRARQSEGGEKQWTYLQGLREAMLEELRRDPSVIVMGQDVRANVFGAVAGFVDEFGPERVLDMPLSENGFIGAAVGAAMTGMRPIVDMSVASFLYSGFDQLISQAAKSRYLFGGQATIPVTYRATLLYGGNAAAQHSDRPYSLFMNIPGLKIIAPSTPSDGKGMLKTAIREDDPVICFEDSALWFSKSTIPEGEHLVPFGSGDVKREGTDVTVVAISGAVRLAISASEQLADLGVSVEVVDPRSLVPLDWETIFQSVSKTGRLVVVDMAHRTCSVASEILATVAEEAFSSLSAPPIRVTTPDTHIPFSPALVAGVLPSTDKITAAVLRVLA